MSISEPPSQPATTLTLDFLGRTPGDVDDLIRDVNNSNLLPSDQGRYLLSRIIYRIGEPPMAVLVYVPDYYSRISGFRPRT